MTVTVVPALRLRRATRGWSYHVPAAMKVQVGSLVIVSFRGHPTIGVVWDLAESGKATQSILEVLTSTPLVRSPHRHLIEWIANYGITSLSTALYSWLPTALRKLPLTKPVREKLTRWDKEQPSARDFAHIKQHLVLVPSERPNAESALSVRYPNSFASTFTDTTPAQEFETWIGIATGSLHVVTGRERALMAPWVNLRHCTVIDPEDISYNTGQSPYISLVAAARELALASNAELSLRSSVPLEAIQAIWPEATSVFVEPREINSIDLRHSRLVNSELIRGIEAALAKQEEVVVLYNAHDRFRKNEDGTRSIIPGIETVAKQIAAEMNLDSLPSSVHLGTRSMLSALPKRAGFVAVLSIDPLLSVTTVADQVHGWGDIGKLTHLAPSITIQSRDPGHPLVQSLERGSFGVYTSSVLAEAARASLPPFCEEVVCAAPPSHRSDADELFEKLLTIAPNPWRVAHPRFTTKRGKELITIALYAPLGTRVPSPLHSFLAELERPWIVERGPWYA